MHSVWCTMVFLVPALVVHTGRERHPLSGALSRCIQGTSCCHAYYSGVSAPSRTYYCSRRATVVPRSIHRRVGPALWSGKRRSSCFETARTSNACVMSATLQPSSATWNIKFATTAPLPVCQRSLMRFAEMRDEAAPPALRAAGEYKQFAISVSR